MRNTLCGLLLVLHLAPQAFGWNELGHKIVASIAFRQLTHAERDRIVEILQTHPRYVKDFQDRMPAIIAAGGVGAKNEWLFQQAAIWPDIARDFHGDLKDQYHRAYWHYINRPHYLSDAHRTVLEPGLTVNLKLDPPTDATLDTEEMNVVQAIRLARKVLHDQAASNSNKAVMLSWLMHGVGDLHQPMHSTALFTPRLYPMGDRGGNLIGTSQRWNLHSLWDTFAGTGGFKEARYFAFGVINDEDSVALGEAADNELNEGKWLEESVSLAKSVAYAPEILSPVRIIEAEGSGEIAPIVVTEDYLKAGGRVAEQRLVEAGYRLGAILKQLAAP